MCHGNAQRMFCGRTPLQGTEGVISTVEAGSPGQGGRAPLFSKTVLMH